MLVSDFFELIMIFIKQNAAGFFISAIIGFFFYLKTNPKAKLSIDVYPTIIIDYDGENKHTSLEVLYNKTKVTSLIKTNIIFWNRGKATIKSDGIAKKDPILIQFNEKTTIFDYQIVRKTSETNNVSISSKDNNFNVLQVDFDYLDYKDGVNIEILHTSEDAPIITGTIIGDKKGLRFDHKKRARRNNFLANLYKNSTFMIIEKIIEFSAFPIFIFYSMYSLFSYDPVTKNLVINFEYSSILFLAIVLILCFFNFWIIAPKYPSSLYISRYKINIENDS